MELIYDTVEANGKTIKENNLMLTHGIPIGTLVEAKYDEWFGEGACMKVHARLIVTGHHRDCDGTPLYSLSRTLWWPTVEVNGLTKDALTVVEVTPRLREGHDALEWEEGEAV